MSEIVYPDDIKLLAASLQKLSPEQLGSLSHSTLYRMREKTPQSQQGLISPYEHRAFAREATFENPLMALPIGVATPLYQPYKAITGKSRSPWSMDQVTQGYKGIGEGLWKAFQDGMLSIQGRPGEIDTSMSATALAESLRRYSPESNTASTNRQLPTKQPASK